MASKSLHPQPAPATGADQSPASAAGRDENGELTPGGLLSDPWSSLRQFTSARIALGRAGGSLPTAELLRFSLDHAEARDAVNSDLDFCRLEKDLSALDSPVLKLTTKATDRQIYLQRPDKGRSLSDESHLQLSQLSPKNRPDIVVILADGLSALATQLHAPAVVKALALELTNRGLTVAPLALVKYARVGVMDEIGSAFRARAALILIGERPGLGSADSLGAYLVFEPGTGKTDADRNCVSNIRPDGLPPLAAVQTLLYLIDQIFKKQISGVSIKDERSAQARLI